MEKQSSHLTLCSILEIAWLFVNTKSTIQDVADATNHSVTTIVEWFLNCSNVCAGVTKLQPQLEGTTQSPIQIDEWYFSGKRKYNCGRVLCGDIRENITNNEDSDDDILT